MRCSDLDDVCVMLWSGSSSVRRLWPSRAHFNFTYWTPPVGGTGLAVDTGWGGAGALQLARIDGESQSASVGSDAIMRRLERSSLLSISPRANDNPVSTDLRSTYAVPTQSQSPELKNL